MKIHISGDRVTGSRTNNFKTKNYKLDPTRSRGISRNSLPCFIKTLPADCAGFTPTPSLVIIALVAAGTLNSSAANFKTAVKGVASGTLSLK